MKKEHRKHAKLNRPSFGKFGRCEIGIIGAPCEVIKKLVTDISNHLPYTSVYLDADHNESDVPSYLSITDGINHHRISYTDQLTSYDIKSKCQESELIYINGNHFLSSSQIVICSKKKKESLQRKLDRLTDVKMILLEEGLSAPWDYLAEIIEKNQPIICSITDQKQIVEVLSQKVEDERPPIKGLILAGGKSVRMGQDKCQINYHGIPQWKYLQGILSNHVSEIMISCRPEQTQNFEGADLLYDTFNGLGPMGALLSAFRKDPDASYLMIACDLPLIKEENISQLVDAVSYSTVATSYHNPETGWPEPMLSIWMPRAYERLMMFLSQGYSCPRKVLINSKVKVITTDNTSFLKNANTPQEKEEIQELIATSAV